MSGYLVYPLIGSWTHLLTDRNNAATSTPGPVVWGRVFSVLSGLDPGVELLSHLALLYCFSEYLTKNGRFPTFFGQGAIFPQSSSEDFGKV